MMYQHSDTHKDNRPAMRLPGKEGFSVLHDHMQQVHNQE